MIEYLHCCIDTNIVIEAAVDPASDSATFIALARRTGIVLSLSRHSLTEIESGLATYGDATLTLARTVALLPYFPKSAIQDLLGPIDQLAGTLDDMDRSHALFLKLDEMAKAGADLHDKGAIVDALWARCSHFVTNDRDLAGSGPRARIAATLPIKIVGATDAFSLLTASQRALLFP